MMREGQMQQQVVNPRDGQFVGGQTPFKQEKQLLEATKREAQLGRSEDVTMGKRPHSDQSQNVNKRAKSEEPSAGSD